jgi:hypothetical protein
MGKALRSMVQVPLTGLSLTKVLPPCNASYQGLFYRDNGRAMKGEIHFLF